MNVPRQVVQDGRLYAYALKWPMDIMTGVGLVSGILVIAVMVLMGKVETDEPFLARGIRYIADGCDME